MADYSKVAAENENSQEYISTSLPFPSLQMWVGTGDNSRGSSLIRQVCEQKSSYLNVKGTDSPIWKVEFKIAKIRYFILQVVTEQTFSKLNLSLYLSCFLFSTCVWFNSNRFQL